MADMYTPEEIQEIFDRYNAALRAGIPISEALAREMADATKGVKNYTATLNQNLKLLGQASKQAAKDITNGAKGTAVFNETIESTGAVVSTVASQFGLLGKGIGLAISALTSWITAVNKQSDALYSNFQQLSRSGAVGAQGMDDVFQNMQRFGYTIDELGKMSSVLTENSKNFAMFSGTAATGSKNLANMIMGMEDARVKFFNLGMTVDDIVRGGAGYYRQLGSLGRANEATVSGAKAYIREMEVLTRLTGLQRRELEEARERAEMIDAFYASLVDLPKEAQQEALAAFNQVFAISPKMAEEFAANFSGIITGTTDLLMATSGQALKFNKEFFASGGKAVDAMQGLGSAMEPFRDLRKDLAQVGAEFGPTFRDVNRFLIKHQLDFARQLGLSEKEVADLEAGLNAATDAQSRTRDSQIKSSNAMQEFINAGINPVTKAMKVLAYAVEYLTNLLPFTGRAKERYEREQQEAASSAAAKVTGGVIDKIIQAESGGRNIGNIGGASSAYGIGQITKDTFKGLVQQATPGSALYGKTFEDMKADVGLQRQALAQLTTQNQRALSKAGFEPTDAATYLAHFLGSPTALRVLQSSNQTPITNVVGADQIRSNANVFKNIATVGDLKAWAERKMGGQGPSGAFGWQGTISGPMTGYNPNIVMHGTEQLSIRPAGSNSLGDFGPNSADLFVKLVERMDEMVAISRNQLGVNEKILKYQQ